MSNCSLVPSMGLEPGQASTMPPCSTPQFRLANREGAKHSGENKTGRLPAQVSTGAAGRVG